MNKQKYWKQWEKVWERKEHPFQQGKAWELETEEYKKEQIGLHKKWTKAIRKQPAF